MPDTAEILDAIKSLAAREAILAEEVRGLTFAWQQKQADDELREKSQRRRISTALTVCVILMALGATFLGAARAESREARRERARVTAALCDISNQAEQKSYDRTVNLLETIKTRVPDENVTKVVDDLLVALPPPTIRTC